MWPSMLRVEIRIIIYDIVVREEVLHPGRLPPRKWNDQIVVAAHTTRMWHMTRVAQMTVMVHNSSGVSISSACETTVVASNPSNISVTSAWMMLACALVSLFRTIEPRLILSIALRLLLEMKIGYQTGTLS
jgi:hypothetical protein